MAVHDFWEVAIPTFSGIIGAFAGGVPSYLLARRGSKEVLERDAQSRRDNERAAAQRVFAKLSILTNSLLDWHQQTEAMIARAERDGHGAMPIAQRLSTYAGIARETMPEFTAEELALFVNAGEVGYIDDLVLLQRRHRAAIDNLVAFGTMRSRLHYQMAEYGETDRDATGMSRTIARVPVGTANRLKLEADELELYAREMRKLLADFAAFAERVATAYGDHIRRYFDDPTMPGFARTEAAEYEGPAIGATTPVAP